MQQFGRGRQKNVWKQRGGWEIQNRNKKEQELQEMKKKVPSTHTSRPWGQEDLADHPVQADQADPFHLDKHTHTHTDITNISTL